MNALRIMKEEPVAAQRVLTHRAEKYVSGYKDLILKYQKYALRYQEYVLFALLLLLWFLMPLLMENRALVTDGLWQLVVMALTCFLGMVGLCWWLLGRFWVIMGLPDMGSMVLRFKQLRSCYQIGFYLASFALLLLAALGCLTAVL